MAARDWRRVARYAILALTVCFPLLAAPDTTRLVLQGAIAEYASPGYLLFAREGNLLAQRFDVDRLESVGGPIAVGKQVAVVNGRGFFSASANGVLAYRMPYTPDYKLAWFDRRGNQLGILPVPAGAPPCLA